MTGLNDIETTKLTALFSSYDEIDRAVLYGSRAKGTYKRFSDIDITLIGENLTSRELNRIANAVDDLMLPYQVDLSLFAQLTNPALIEHINRVGITIYHNNS